MEYISAIASMSGGRFSHTDLLALVGVAGALGTVKIAEDHPILARLEATARTGDAEACHLLTKLLFLFGREACNRPQLLNVITGAPTQFSAMIAPGGMDAKQLRLRRRDLLLSLLYLGNFTVSGGEVMDLFDMDMVVVAEAMRDIFQWQNHTDAVTLSSEERLHVVSSACQILYSIATWKAFADCLPLPDEVMSSMENSSRRFNSYIDRIIKAVMDVKLLSALAVGVVSAVSQEIFEDGANTDTCVEAAGAIRVALSFLDNLFQYSTQYCGQLRSHVSAEPIFFTQGVLPLLVLLTTGCPAVNESLKRDNLIGIISSLANIAYRVPAAALLVREKFKMRYELLHDQASIWSGDRKIEYLRAATRLLVNANMSCDIPALLAWWSVLSPDDKATLAHKCRNPSQRSHPINIRSECFSACGQIFTIHASKSRATKSVSHSGALSPSATRGRGSEGSRRTRSKSRSRRGGRKRRSRINRRKRRYERLKNQSEGLPCAQEVEEPESASQDQENLPASSGVAYHTDELPSDLDSSSADSSSGDEDPSSPAKSSCTELLSQWQQDACCGVPRRYLCDLTHKIMKTPVLTPTGHTFDLFSIVSFLEKHGNVCPLSGEPLFPNDLLRDRRLETEIASVRGNYIFM